MNALNTALTFNLYIYSKKKFVWMFTMISNPY
jgi:hypothetical protein